MLFLCSHTTLALLLFVFIVQLAPDAESCGRRKKKSAKAKAAAVAAARNPILSLDQDSEDILPQFEIIENIASAAASSTRQRGRRRGRNKGKFGKVVVLQSKSKQETHTKVYLDEAYVESASSSSDNVPMPSFDVEVEEG